MRVLSGKYKNREIKSISDNSVRPTPSSIKKSLFQILEPFNGKKILDLFAGTGSLGIEALSRNALKATFVEKDKRIFKVLSSNLDRLCHKHEYEIINMDVFSYIKKCSTKYDIIFADPPYNSVLFKELQLKIGNLLNYKGIFCMERMTQKDEYDDVRIKNYGKTQVLIWQKIIK